MINPLDGFNPAVFLREIILLYSRSENNFPQGKEFNVFKKTEKCTVVANSVKANS